jgi:hypothetical protein
MWLNDFHPPDQFFAASPQISADRVGKDDRIGRPEQRLVTRLAMLVVEVVVPAELVR